MYRFHRLGHGHIFLGATTHPTAATYKREDIISYIKVNSNYIIHLNVKSKTIKFLEENMEENFCDVCLGKDFLDIAQSAQSIKF